MEGGHQQNLSLSKVFLVHVLEVLLVVLSSELVCIEKYNKDLESGVISNECKFLEYRSENNLYLSNEELILLGLELVILLSNNSNLIEVKVIKRIN